MGIQICSNKCWGAIRGKIRNFINLQKCSSHEPLAECNGIGMNHPLGEGIQLYTNEVPRVMYGPVPGA